MAALVLAAPVDGWLMALDEVPDPAFAGRMVGDGAAIDPTDSMLRAPCDGVVTMLADTRHALTLQTESGIDILLHVGIDTVRLGGAGLVARTRRGAAVRRGDPLVEMDLDRLARGATSLVTPIVVMDSQRYRVTPLMRDCAITAGDAILEITAADPAQEERGPAPAAARPDARGVARAGLHPEETGVAREGLRPEEGGMSPAGLRPEERGVVRAGLHSEERDVPPAGLPPDAHGEVSVRLEHGLHARPAARIVRLSRRFRARVVLSAHGRDAEAGSTVALMALGVACGDTVELKGFGDDAGNAVRALIDEIASGAGESPIELLAPQSAPEPAEPALSRELRGIVASPGVAIGIARQFETPEIAVPETGAGVDEEQGALDLARATVRRELTSLAEAAEDGGDMLGAQGEFLDDPGLLAIAEVAIAQGKSAGFAWRAAVRKAAEQLRATGDARLAERVADLRDIECQVLESLTGRSPQAPELPESAIVLAEELLPSQLGRLDLAKVAGFCSAAGGRTSHVALLAASLGIPALVAAGPGVHGIPDGARVLLDAETGRLRLEPDDETLAKAERRIAERHARRGRFLQEAAQECRTADGHRIELFANLASVAEASNAVRCGAEGCGLLRTEFLFQHRAAAPTVGEQAAEYRAIAEALAPRPLVIRLLDAGGDKPIPYLRLPREENPLLGLRGLRVGLRYPQLLRDQLAAILSAANGADVRVLLPMVTEPGEIRRVRELIAEDEAGGPISIGAMIETPASVALADAIAREADFLSIGSNDLAQYTLAVDRAHPVLGRAFDSLHPAVLRQIAHVCEAAGGAKVSVCGALASDPAAVPLLVGLGVRTLSAVPDVIPELKALLRAVSLAECRELAAAALEQNDAAGLRSVVEDAALAARLS